MDLFINRYVNIKYLSVHLPRLSGQPSENVGFICLLVCLFLMCFSCSRCFGYYLLFHKYAKLKSSRFIFILRHKNISAK